MHEIIFKVHLKVHCMFFDDFFLFFSLNKTSILIYSSLLLNRSEDAYVIVDTFSPFTKLLVIVPLSSYVLFISNSFVITLQLNDFHYHNIGMQILQNYFHSHSTRTIVDLQVLW